MKFQDVLSRGYFPKELPAPFTSESYASLLGQYKGPPGDFGNEAKKGVKTPSAKVARYSHARGGLTRRQLSICNPLLYYLLAKEITKNWSRISVIASGTPLAATAPEYKSTGRAINGKYSLGARSKLSQSSRLGKRFVLRTDISRFYHSIYTHSIAWALHTKKKAKANHSFALLGNKLDYWVRQGQDRQTVGIPIGPDTSLVLAELIMHRCDEALVSKIPNIKGHRFIDDYELSFDTRTEAEDAFHILETCLAEYELALNPKKTDVCELPLPLEAPWATELKRFSISTGKNKQTFDLEAFFSVAFKLYQANPGEPVLQFALARLRRLAVHTENWVMFQKLVLLCVAPEPACLPYALEQIIRRANAGATPLRNEIEELVNTLLIKHSELNHSSEVANALWANLALNLKLHTDAVDAVSKCDDSTVALLALDCENKGLLLKPLDHGLFSSFMTSDALYDDHWLLAYEANIQGWLPSVGSKDHVNDDPNFGFMKSNGVSFYDQNLASGLPEGPIPLPSLPTISTGGSY